MKSLKLIALTALISVGAMNSALANSKAAVKDGVSLFHTNSAEIYCYKHATDICIDNRSDQTVFFTVPQLNAYDDSLDPPAWADVHSSYLYYNLSVTIVNSDNQVIFNQTVPNHSIIDVGDELALVKGAKTKKLVVRVRT